MTYTRHHPSYISGRSAPSTPGILSRSSSRRHLSGGLSRRGSLYDDSVEVPTLVYPDSGRSESDKIAYRGTSGMRKAQSEAALSVRQVHNRLAGQGVPVRRPAHQSRTHGANTPRQRNYAKHAGAGADEDWLSRASAATNALLLESKGQAWISSRDSSAALDMESEDEGYEEMAAMSAAPGRTTAPTLAEQPLGSPLLHRWGSRYGSRSASRRTSRRGSMTNVRTPLAPGQELDTGYFDSLGSTGAGAEVEDIREENEGSDGEAELEQLARNRSMGFGGLVDKVVGFSLFGGVESEESGVETETEGEDGKEEGKRLKMPPSPPPAPSNEREKVGVWEDAAWLLSIAGRALTQ